MRICFIADYGSLPAIKWIDHLAKRGDEVHVISTGLCNPHNPSVKVHPLAGLGGSERRSKYRMPDPASMLGKAALMLHEWVIDSRRILEYSRTVNRLVKEIQPDLLHAMRIPIEGELGMLTGFHPFVVTIWGNDLTLHARNSPVNWVLTKRTLETADAVLADCNADLLRTAGMLGKEKPVTLVCPPGTGGVRPEVFRLKTGQEQCSERWRCLAGRPVIVNPRGVRAYVRHDTVFRALALIRDKVPDVVLVSAGLKDWAPAHRWIRRLDLSDNIILTEVLRQEELAELFRLSHVSLSISEHDGTPNSLLEAMASGAVPICGRLESTQEWIQSGVNGWLVAADSPQMLAEAVLKTISDQAFRQKARELNQVLIRDRATYPECKRPVEELYMHVANHAEMFHSR
jgi:glycosyltransferase involved in cell wall biosynthesis